MRQVAAEFPGHVECWRSQPRQLVDVAFSGNGEPTSTPEFAQAIELAGELLQEFGLLDSAKLRLITNGSLKHRPVVWHGFGAIGRLGGEVGFKLERATDAGIEQVNGIRVIPEKIRESLMTCAELAPTWVHTCCFAIDGNEAGEAGRSAYFELGGSLKEKMKGVHLYGLARPSLQASANRLSNLSLTTFQRFARNIALQGIEAVANP